MKVSLFFGLFGAMAIAGLGCNNKAPDSTSPAASVPPAASSVAPPPEQPSLVQKALSFLGAGPFEGEIAMTFDTEGKPEQTVTFEMKGTKTRFDAPQEMQHGSPGWVIYDSATKNMIAISEKEKTAVTMQMDFASARMAASHDNPFKDATVEKTGRTDVVAGYSCDVLKVTDAKGNHGEVCVAQGIPFPMAGLTWVPNFEGGFPLRGSGVDANGKDKMKMEVTRIERKSIDDSRLQVPAGYRAIDMAAMMKGMKGFGANMPH